MRTSRFRKRLSYHPVERMVRLCRVVGSNPFGLISDTLRNPEAARKLTRRIVQAVSLSADNPYMGRRSTAATRMIDGRQGYMAILF